MTIKTTLTTIVSDVLRERQPFSAVALRNNDDDNDLDVEQGRLRGYPSRVRVGRGNGKEANQAFGQEQ